MQLKFNIQETVETELYYGFYTIYILGGFMVKTNPDFYIEIINTETSESIELTEKYLKARDFKSGKRAVKFYTFEISNYGNFKISAHNYEDMVVKRHYDMLLFPNSKPQKLEEIEIYIQ